MIYGIIGLIIISFIVLMCCIKHNHPEINYWLTVKMPYDKDHNTRLLSLIGKYREKLLSAEIDDDNNLIIFSDGTKISTKSYSYGSVETYMGSVHNFYKKCSIDVIAQLMNFEKELRLNSPLNTIRGVYHD